MLLNGVQNLGLCADNCDSWVQTDLGNYGAVALGFKEAEITTEESVNGMGKIIDEATREKSSGKFWLYTGEQKPW
jgi:norsolorinic acid ketoreductase